jgi:8-oxo-dGTP pyrophosphatase MutT (NUDIX family)
MRREVAEETGLRDEAIQFVVRMPKDVGVCRRVPASSLRHRSTSTPVSSDGVLALLQHEVFADRMKSRQNFNRSVAASSGHSIGPP